MTEEEILSNPTVQFILQYFEENQNHFGIFKNSDQYSANQECYQLIVALLSSLSEEIRRYLLNYKKFEENKEWFWLIINTLHTSIPGKYTESPKPLNTSTRLLIKWYADKRSKKVCLARKEIKERFLYLDAKDQFKILKLFLDGIMADRMFAYRIYEDLWDETALRKIIECWQNATNVDEWQRIGLLIIHKASKNDLKTLNTALYINAQGQGVQILYKEYCMRFIGDADFVVEQQYFHNPASYYDVLLTFRKRPYKDKFESDLYHLVVLLYAEAYYRIYPALIRHQRYSGDQQFHYPHKIYISDDKYRELHLCEVYDIRRMLALASRFGYMDIVGEFVAYASKVDAEVATCEGKDCERTDIIQRLKNEDDSYSVGFDPQTQNVIPYFNLRALPMKTYFPEKYMADLLEFEESPVCKQAAEDVIALATRTELEEECLRDEIENDKWREVSDFDMYNLGPF